MPRIARVHQKIFASNAANNGQFGSARLGTKLLTNDLTQLMGLAAYLAGWSQATISGDKLPTLEEMQALDYIITTQLAYLFQEGIPEWSAGATYYTNSMVKKAGTYQLYGSLIDNNTNNALPSGVSDSNWLFLTDLSASNLDKAEVSIAAAGTTAIGSVNSYNAYITGSGFNITSFGTVAAGTVRKGRFAGTGTLTHNGTSLILPGAANITVAAGDQFEALSLGSGNWDVRYYSKANGQAVALGVQPLNLGGTGQTTQPGAINALMPSQAAAAKLAAYSDGTNVLFGGQFMTMNNFMHVQHQTSSGVAGGATVGGAYATRSLNTVVTNNIVGASLASNQVTLPAGTYFIEGVSPIFNSSQHKCALYNVTDAAYAIIGKPQSTSTAQTESSFGQMITIAAQKVFELRYRTSGSQGSNGQGVPSTFGDIEIYSEMRIWKVS